MRIRHGVEGAKGEIGQKTSSEPQATGLALASPAQRLDYIAAMIRELGMLAAQADFRTLTGLLDLAYQEALRRRAGE